MTSGQPTNPDDPTSPEALEESRVALIQLLEHGNNDALQAIGAGLQDGKLELSLDASSGFDASWVAKLCLPTSMGRQDLDRDTEAELLESIRSVVHAGDAWVSQFRITAKLEATVRGTTFVDDP